MVLVGSARSNEYGKVTGGKPGDQKGGSEVSTQPCYLHQKGWVLIRVIDLPAATIVLGIVRNIVPQPQLPHRNTVMIYPK